jgi:hypothetical protein
MPAYLLDPRFSLRQSFYTDKYPYSTGTGHFGHETFSFSAFPTTVGQSHLLPT